LYIPIVHEIAEVFIGGEQAGTLWLGEKRIDITDFIVKNRKAENKYQITAQLSATWNSTINKIYYCQAVHWNPPLSNIDNELLYTFTDLRVLR
jgi:hypothetical protein